MLRRDLHESTDLLWGINEDVGLQGSLQGP